jgi:vitamin B12 transporter
MSKRISPFVSIALILPAVASHAASEDSAQTLEPVVVTASRTAQPLKAVIGDVTVIDRKTLERFSGESVLSALQGQAGVQVTSNGGAGKSSSVFLRGANSSHTLVLIDGVRYGSATGGSAALEHIPADQIERVEILRGAAASLYGSDAIGGVIQIFTRQGKNTPQASLQLGYGTQDSRQASFSISGQQGNTHASLTFAHTQTDSVSAISNPKNSNYFADTDGYENSSIGVKLSHELAGGHQVGGSVLWSDNQGQYDASTYDFATNTSGAQHYNYRNDSENGAAQLWAQLQLSEKLNSRLQAGYSTDDGKSYSPTSVTNLTDQLSLFRTVQQQYVWQN